MGLAIISYDGAGGLLREVYNDMRKRPVAVAYRPPHDGVAGIIEAHSLDPMLIPRVFGCAATLNSAGPLLWPERELVNATTSRLNQCSYSTASHAEFLRLALGDDALARTVLADPHRIARDGSNPRLAMIVELAIAVTEAPWQLTRNHLSRAYRAGLGDEDVLQVVLLSSFVGHLNRIADVVALPLDYHVKLATPPVDHQRTPWPAAPSLVAGRVAIDVARRPTTANAFTDWRHYAFYSRDTPLSRRQRTLIARSVATWLGDGGISSPDELTGNPLDEKLRAVAEVVILAPWRLADTTFAPLRAAGFDDPELFDLCATATAAAMFSRVEVALAAMAVV